jgi:molybdenum cofactor cytidylyltransferase
MTSEVYAVVLAAGSASRFGRTKQLVELDGVALVSLAVNSAAEVLGHRTVTVVGHDATNVASELRHAPGFVVVNEDYAQGLGTSLARAITAIRHVAKAVIVILADQPGVESVHINELIRTWSGDDKEIVATAFSGTQGPPVLFPAGCFDELAELQGDAGGKHLFKDSRFCVATVDCAPAALDIDTPEDLRRI